MWKRREAYFLRNIENEEKENDEMWSLFYEKQMKVNTMYVWNKW